MNQYEMVVVIVLIVVIGGVLSKRFSKHSKGHPLNGAENQSLKEVDDKRIKQLEQRIEVLESIVTSDGYELKQRFKDLKHEQQETN